MNKKKDVLKTKQQPSYGYPSSCIGASMYRRMGVWVPPYLGISMSWRMKYMRSIYSWICSWIYPWVCKRCKIHGELFFSLLSWGMFLFLTMGGSFFVSAQDTECRELLSIQGAQDGSVMEATETVEVDRTTETVGVVEMDRTLETVKTVESVKAGEKDKLEDDTERFLAYLGYLLEENILKDKHLQFMQEGLKKGKIENPLSKTEASMEMKTYVHWEGLTEHLDGPLDSTRIGDWVEIMRRQKAQEREQRNVVREATKKVPEPFQKFKIKDAQFTSSIKLKDGRILAGTKDARVLVFNTNGDIYKDLQIDNYGRVIGFLELEDGRVWVILKHGHVSILNLNGSIDKSFYIDSKLKPFWKDPIEITSFFKSKNGRVLIGANSGYVFTYYSNGILYNEFHIAGNDHSVDVIGFLELEDRRVWMISMFGHVSMNRPDGSFYDNFQVANGEDWIRFFLKLKNGKVLLISLEGHVSIHHPDGSYYDDFQVTGVINSLLELPDGKVLLGSTGGHIYTYNLNGNIYEDSQMGHNQSIQYFLGLRDGRTLIVSSEDYLSIRYKDGSIYGKFKISENNLFQIESLFELPDGKIFVTATNGYIGILDLDMF